VKRGRVKKTPKSFPKKGKKGVNLPQIPNVPHPGEFLGEQSKEWDKKEGVY